MQYSMQRQGLLYLVIKVGVVIHGERLSIQEHLPRVWLIEPLEEADTGALTTTTGAWGCRREVGGGGGGGGGERGRGGWQCERYRAHYVAEATTHSTLHDFHSFRNATPSNLTIMRQYYQC